MIGGKGTNNPFKSFKIGGKEFSIRYGSKVFDLPFSIKLNDFIAEKYPGTEKSYSSFASEVTVIDENPFDYRIYMNNILNYKGYRFFKLPLIQMKREQFFLLIMTFGGLC